MESLKASHNETATRGMETENEYELDYYELSEKPNISEGGSKSLQKVDNGSTRIHALLLLKVSIAFNVVFLAFLIALVAIAASLMYNIRELQQRNQLVNETSQLPDQRPSSGTCILTAKNCDEIRQAGYTASGTYQIRLRRTFPSDIRVLCNMEPATGWSVIQRRVDGSVKFHRGWAEYKSGFGDVEHEFWLGLEAIHILTQRPSKLRIRLESWTGEWRSAVYSTFSVANETQNYTLTISGFLDGGLGDSLEWHNNMAFTTKDRDNDEKPLENCAIEFRGAWWYNNCLHSNLNGIYYQGGKSTSFATGAVWFTWKGLDYSYKTILMEISPA